jgi:hypothetical protein
MLLMPLKAVSLVLDAPLKDFVYVAGSFNGWEPNSNYAMKKRNLSQVNFG